ncbi:hypothetical protein Tco_1114228 [Tanacetum coccineum]|uniref:Peptidase A2 domain-containing protein n=1 Tax=Tanacetum coccineum TaxID=301880 RepID=A0ABQ5IVY5_9ASTR
METKDTLSSCSNSEEQQMQQMLKQAKILKGGCLNGLSTLKSNFTRILEQGITKSEFERAFSHIFGSDAISKDKAQERCMVSYRQLHSHLKHLSHDNLKGTRIESGFKRAFATLFETFIGTMFQNVDQLEKQLDKEEFQEIGSTASFKVLETQFQMFIKSRIYLDDEYVDMTRNKFLQYTQLAITEFRDTLIQHMESVKKSIDERAQHKREYDSWVNERQIQTTEDKVDTGKAMDANNLPFIYEEAPMAEIVIETINIELEHKVLRTIRTHNFSGIAIMLNSRLNFRKMGFAIAALKNEYSSNDMVHKHYLEEAKKKTQESSRNSEPSVMPSARSRAQAMASLLMKYGTSDSINSSELEFTDHSNELSSSKLVPKVVPPADKTATSRQKLESLFHHHITMLRTTSVNKSLRIILVDSDRNILELILFSIHNDEWKSFQCHHQTALRSYALSWKPCQGDSLNLPDHRIHKDGDVWKDTVELDGKIVKEEEETVKRIKGEALKEKDYPGAFIFPIRLEGQVNKNALADTGSDINTMPYRIYEQLRREDIKKGFLRTIGGIVNTPKRLFLTFDGFCHQTFRAARSDVMRNRESDSDDEEEYQIQRNKIGAPIYGPKPAPYLNCNDPVERSLAIQTKPDYKGSYTKEEEATGQWRTEIRITDLYGNIYLQGFTTKKTDRKLLQYHKLSDIMSPNLWEHTMMRPDHHDPNALDNMKSWKRYCFHKFIMSSCYVKDVTEMQSLGCDGEIDDMLRIRLREVGSAEEIFTSVAWIRAFNINEPIYVELCYKFYSTYEFDEVCADDEFQTKKIIKFRLGGRAHNLTLLEFAQRLGLYQAVELEEEGFNIYFEGGLRSDEHFNAQDYWLSISREENRGLSRSHTSTIKNLILRVIYKMITYGLCQRTIGYDKVQKNDMWLLSMFDARHQNGYANVAWLIARWMKRKGAGTQKKSQI